jgi:hypothetical protein
MAADDAVVVKAMRDPVSKSYRRMVEGMELFERRRQLAPRSTLRFRLLARKHGTALENVELEVAADSLAIPLEVAPDGTFALVRDQVALREDARVMPNRRSGTMTWRADVRTPGLPPDTRRLGDLRLECEVGMQSELISSYPAGFLGWLDRLILAEGPGYCHRAAPRYLFFAERPLFGVTLVDGARREAVPVDRLYGGATRDRNWKKELKYCDCESLFDRSYFLPLGDPGWPDDTLVELEYMDGAPAAESTKADIRKALGEPRAIDFANAYAVWVYREKTTASSVELVFLFDPSGRLARTRIR